MSKTKSPTRKQLLVKEAEELGIKTSGLTVAKLQEAIDTAVEAAQEKESKKAVKRIKHQNSAQPGSLRDQGGSVVFVVTGDGVQIIEGVQGNGNTFTANIADALGTTVEELLASDSIIYTVTASTAYKSTPESRPGNDQYAEADLHPDKVSA